MKKIYVSFLCIAFFISCDVPSFSDGTTLDSITTQNFSSNKIDNIDIYIRKESNHKEIELLKTISILPNETLTTNIRLSSNYFKPLGGYEFIAIIRSKIDTLTIAKYYSNHEWEVGSPANHHIYIDETGVLTRIKPTN
jgi:hypothetical protein